MSAQLVAHIASDDDDDTSKDLMTFCIKTCPSFAVEIKKNVFI